MARPLYDNGLSDAKLKSNGHKGLWYERFFDGYKAEFHDLESEESKGKWVNRVTGPAGDGDACIFAARRLHELCKCLDGQTRIFTGAWHFATGMGLPHPVENGFLWHHTLGAPYIPGVAVKGLVRAWLESWAEFDNEKQRMEILYRWFGSEDKDPRERKKARQAGFVPPSRNLNLDPDTEAGRFIFFDALPVTPPGLKADIMTPHMGKWYEMGGEPSSDPAIQAERTPADWHDPTPIVFLVADKPSFQFAIAPRTPDAGEELSQVMAVLEEALEWLGAGAKTAVGYGQFENRNEQLPSPGPRHPWLVKTIPLLMEDNNERNPDNVWGGKLLAQAWRELDDFENKAAILDEIRSYWQEKDWWDNPPRGAKRMAKAIYVDE